MSTIAFEKVGQAINDWYKVIKQNNIPKATAMRAEIEKKLPNMKENQNVLLYFSLIDSRYKLMTENYNESGELLDDIRTKALEAGTDDMIQYYFYFFSGLYQFYKKNFVDAINFYMIAENRLHKVPDEIEKAEFHYQLAIAYYEIRQNFFSLSYAQKALDSFKAHEDYTNRVIKCKMLFAMNKVDLQEWEDAIDLYKDAILLASQTNDKATEGLGFFNLGICYEKQNVLERAIECFQSALSIPEHRESIYSIRSMYMLSRVFYKADSISQARKWHNKALNFAEKVKEKMYIAKLNFIYSLYDKSNPESLDYNLNKLKEKNFWYDVADLCELAAFYYKKQENTDLSSKYFEGACKAKDQILRLTEALT
ncbi:aspartate phosphatase [Bacillus haynesii]|uniref:response regulator aspartate phosphatase n=1 Tax=Bacillus haynesii TaxID=1925021 RepID=UPI00227DD3A2|nr:aspartate phosphatase [Bacillus haynesii]MCY9399770.1 aspartate phosphatase [Bacillus haynesii]MEC0723120.1 aspartate phosphatase [Bacillus haynesii]